MLCLSAAQALLTCVFFACTFVGTLYIWNSKKEKALGVTVSRDDPSVIKRRFISVGITVVISTFAVFTFWSKKENEVNCELVSSQFTKDISVFLKYLGIHFEGIVFAITLPLLLSMILFLGPLVLLYVEPDLRDPIFSLDSLIWWRNFIVVTLN